MSGLFKDLSASLARFVYAWLVPSVAAVTAFTLLVLPDLQGISALGPTRDGVEPLKAAGLFTLAVVLLSILFAYTSLPLYRLLEGYKLPRALQTRLLSRHLREWYRLQAREKLVQSATERGLLLEKLRKYPEHAQDVMPTKLGNAMRCMERYGTRRFGLDSQTLWYELRSVVPETQRRDVEDARASVDFFLSAIGHLALLGAVSAGVAAWSFGISSAIVAAASFGLIPVAYGAAVRNVEDWRSTIQALVNTGRTTLPPALGLRLPATFEAERELWLAYRRLVLYGADPRYFEVLDKNREPTRAVAIHDAPFGSLKDESAVPGGQTI